MYSYKVYAVIENGTVQAFGVLRLIFVEHGVVFRLVDFVGPSEKIVDFFKGVNRILEEFDGEYLDCYSYGIPKKYFEEAGALNRKDTRGLVIPDYFEPFLKENQDLLIGFNTIYPASDVRLFKGDGDQDRPNRIPERVG